MAPGRKTGGRQEGARNRATEEARAAAEATGIMPVAYMLAVMRDAAADHKRRDATAMAAAPYPHARLSTIDATLSPAVAEPPWEKTSVVVEFGRARRRSRPGVIMSSAVVFQNHGSSPEAGLRLTTVVRAHGVDLPVRAGEPDTAGRWRDAAGR